MTDSKPTPEHRAFVEGYEAFLKRCPKERAPESPRREHWIEGWEKAEEDAANSAEASYYPLYGDEFGDWD